MTNTPLRRVLFLPGWYPTRKGPLSGVFVRDHVTAASAISDVVLVRFGEPAEDENVDCRVISVDKPRCLGIRVLAHVGGVVAMLRAIKGLIRGGWHPDLVHVHVCLSAAGVCGFLVALILRVPLVISEHWSGYIRDVSSCTALRIRCVGIPIFNRAAVVCPVSRHLGDALVGWGVRSAIEIVPNVVELSKGDDELPRHVTEFLNIPGVKKLLFIGTNFGTKGLDDVILALSMVYSVRQDFRLLVIGGTHPAEVRGYEATIRGLGLDPVICLAGVLPPVQTAQAIRLCDFGIQPSRRETFGIAILEYIGAGKPVITSDIEPIRTLVPPDFGGFVEPGDVVGLSRTIEEFLERDLSEHREAMVSYVEDLFSLATLSKRLSHIYYERIQT